MKKTTLSIISIIVAASSVGARDFMPLNVPDIQASDIEKAQSRIEMFHRTDDSRAATGSPITSRDELLGVWVEYYNSPGNIYGSIQNLWANHFIMKAGVNENEIYLQNIMGEKYLQIAATVDVASGYIDIRFPQLVGYDGSAAVYLYSYDIENSATLLDGTISMKLQRNAYDNKIEFIADLPMVYFAEYQNNFYLMDMSVFITGKQPNANLAYKNAQTAGTPTEADFSPIDYRVDVLPGYDEKDKLVAMQVSTVTANGTGIPVVFDLEYPGIGIADNEVGDYIYSESNTKPADGYYQLFTVLSASSAAPEVRGAFNSDMTKFEFDKQHNWMLYDASKGAYQGENKPATITFDVPFPSLSAPASITGIETDTDQEPAEYFDMFGRRVSNPAPGQMLIRRQGQSATKIIAD